MKGGGPRTGLQCPSSRRSGVYVLEMAFEGLRRDLAVYARLKGAWFLRPGLWIAATYRVGASARGIPSPPVKFAVLALHKLLVSPWRLLCGVHVPHNATIGPGLYLPHPREIMLAPGSVFGAECSVYQDVVVGRGPVPGVPQFGDRVVIFPGVRVLGGIRVGDDAHIGPNTVVVRDVPARTVVSAPASRIIPKATAERTATGGPK